jgi:hypothetical protein
VLNAVLEQIKTANIWIENLSVVTDEPNYEEGVA